MPIELTIPEQKLRSAIRRGLIRKLGRYDPSFVFIVSGWIEPALSSPQGRWIVSDLDRSRFTFMSVKHMTFSAQAVVHFGEEFEETAIVPFKWTYRKGKYKATFDFKKAKPVAKNPADDHKIDPTLAKELQQSAAEHSAAVSDREFWSQIAYKLELRRMTLKEARFLTKLKTKKAIQKAASAARRRLDDAAARYEAASAAVERAKAI